MHHLLIVDDQPDLVDDLAEMLPWHSVGIGKVHKAYSAPEALEIVMSHPIDVVITDIRMPGMSGLDLIERIRTSWKKIRCILLSGYDDFEYAKRALQYQANDYLLKPADDNELLEAVAKAVKEIEDEWKDVSSLRNAINKVKQNLPVLRNHLLLDLLENKHSDNDFWDKAEMLEIPFVKTSPVYLMLVRLEDAFQPFNGQDEDLVEFAITNISEEIFADTFHIWHVKDMYGYLVYVIQQKRKSMPSDMSVKDQIEMKASLMQHNVNQYLKGTISVVISSSGRLTQDIRRMYEHSIASFRQRIGGDKEFLLSIDDNQQNATETHAANSLALLYEPPLLAHLLETANWSAMEQKLEAIFSELEQKWSHSHEHILETYFMIVSSFSFSIHKNKRWMSNILADEFQKIVSGVQFHTIQQLRDWTYKILDLYRQDIEAETQDNRSNTIRQVQEYVQNHLGEASLQSIAAHVYLNPSYLSKIYKRETGEGISDFLYRLKMDQAAHKLRSSNEKIYEIAASLGYVKTSYFIKVFKDKYGMTPQEYRDKVTN